MSEHRPLITIEYDGGFINEKNDTVAQLEFFSHPEEYVNLDVGEDNNNCITNIRIIKAMDD